MNFEDVISTIAIVDVILFVAIYWWARRGESHYFHEWLVKTVLRPVIFVLNSPLLMTVIIGIITFLIFIVVLPWFLPTVPVGPSWEMHRDHSSVLSISLGIGAIAMLFVAFSYLRCQRL